MKKIVVILSALLVLVGLIGTSIAAGPAPYTEPALDKLSKSADKLGAFVPPVGSTKEDATKHLIQFYSKIYSQAGFSFEKSVIQFSNDLNKDPDFMSNVIYRKTPALISEMFSNQLNEIRKDNKLKSIVDKSLSKDTIRALDNIMSIAQKKEAEIKAENERQIQIAKAAQEKEIMENEAKQLKEIEADKIKEQIAFEIQKKDLESKERIKAAEAEKREEQAKHQAELESIEKQNTLKRLNGHYEKSSGKGNTRKIDGTLDVKITSEDKATISIYNDFAGAVCRMENVDVSIEYGNNNSIYLMYGKESDVKKDNVACAIQMKFRETDSSSLFQVDQQGCKHFCGRGGNMLGKYKKVD